MDNNQIMQEGYSRQGEKPELTLENRALNYLAMDNANLSASLSVERAESDMAKEELKKLREENRKLKEELDKLRKENKK